jgi:phospholipid transport system substrate-binding protein
VFGASEAGAPTDGVREFFAGVNLVLNDPAMDDQPQERLRAIRRLVDEVFDFREAAMLVLGREWAAHTADQNEFVALFADLVERSFVWRVAGTASLSGGVRVDYVNEVARRDTATVETTIATRDGNALRLDYRLVYRSGRWVVRDVVMDGVSTMDNYRAQFHRLARDVSWPDVMAQLRAKLVAAGTSLRAAARPSTIAPSAAPVADRVAEPTITPPATMNETSPPVATAVLSSPSIAAVPAPAVAAAPPPRAARSLWIQVGAYRNSGAAARVAAQVNGEVLVVVTPASLEPPLLRVRVGPFTDRAHALERLHQLERQGWRAFVTD